MFIANSKNNVLPKDEFKFNLLRLFSDNAYWTRMFIVSSLGNLPDVNDVMSRLIKSTKDLGAYVGSFYPSIGSDITQLFTNHITYALHIIESSKFKKDASTIRTEWYKNSDNIANSFFKVNPNVDIRNILYKNIQLLESAINSRLSKNYANEILYFDDIVLYTNKLSDTISNAIINHKIISQR